MNQAGRDTGSDTSAKVRDVRMILLGTIADTTWRMFVPVIGGALIGYMIDRAISSRPVGVITGMMFGIVIAVLLVVQQYRRIKQLNSEETDA